MIQTEKITRKAQILRSYLDERQLRIWAALEAESIGRGGIAAVERATGISHTTIGAGLAEIRPGARRAPPGAVRHAGAGRKPLTAAFSARSSPQGQCENAHPWPPRTLARPLRTRPRARIANSNRLSADDDILWLGNTTTNFVSKSMNQVDDYSPLVGVYNGDGCDDILWFAPHTTYRVEPLNSDPTGGDETTPDTTAATTEATGGTTTGTTTGGGGGEADNGPLSVVQGFSPLWRSVCNPAGTSAPSSFAGFVVDEPQAVPVDSYPVGYNPRVGRWAQ